jgi:fumarate hydratase, class II
VTTLYGEQTRLAVENFPVSGQPVDEKIIRALALIKSCAAQSNAALDLVPQEIAAAISAAADRVAAGEFPDQFPIDVFQTGSGTSSNMNVNEVVATLASQAHGAKIHPNDHVNASQSSNDVFPTALHIACAVAVTNDLIPSLQHLAATLEEKANQHQNSVKSGRTHLMDAVPVTLGQEFAAYATQIRNSIMRINSALPGVLELPLGGTATGTRLNAPSGFAERAIALLAERTGLPLTEAPDHVEAQGARDGLVHLSGSLRTAAVSLTKIADDLRWMSSGPRTGLGEIQLPELQKGSSIMPGKVNPVICESVLQVCAQVIGNDAAIAWAGARGNFELNTMQPMMGQNALSSITLLANAAKILADKAIAGIEVDLDHLRRLAESSPSIVTSLNRFLGYDEAAEIAKQALKEKRTIKEVVIARGHVSEGRISEADLDAALDVLHMSQGG